MEAVASYISEIVTFILGAVTGSLLTIYVKSQRGSGRSNVVDQSRASAGGDIVGRDKR